MPFLSGQGKLARMLQIKQSSQPTSAEKKQKAEKAYQKLLARADVGFVQAPQRDPLWSSSQELGDQLREKYSDLVVVGIGGSALGPMVIRNIFQEPDSQHRVHFSDNVDRVEFERLLKTLPDLKKTAWLIISKSGSTIETLVTTDFISQVYRQKHLKFHENVFVISENRSNPLTQWAQANNRPLLEIPLDVGGRYSVLTPVGLVPARFLGVDLSELQKGAADAIKNKELVCELTAQILQSFQRHEWVTPLFIYSSLLSSFGYWWQQLWAESLAKKIDRTGMPAQRVSTPTVAIGVRDQHSLLQQMMEGAKDKFIIFVRVRSAEQSTQTLESSEFPIHNFFSGKAMEQLLGVEADATAKALTKENISNMTIELNDLSPYSIGYLFMIWKLVVATVGESIDINAFDQPGVELGKRLALDILKS